MIAAAVVVVGLVHLVLGLAFAPGARPHPITEAVFAFIAFYFLLLLVDAKEIVDSARDETRS
jgi:hypothetical protein